jgi:hypothetical protein
MINRRSVPALHRACLHQHHQPETESSGREFACKPIENGHDSRSKGSAADVCRVLDITNPRDAASRLDDDEKADIRIMDDSSGQHRNYAIVSESGLYSLIMTSRKPVADPAQDLCAIRTEIVELKRRINQLEARMAVLAQRIDLNAGEHGAGRGEIDSS